MQSDIGDVVDRFGRKVLGNNLSSNLSTNGSDTGTKCSNLFKIPQTSLALMTSTPKNRQRKISVMAESMQTTCSSVDMGYSTMGCSEDMFKTPASQNYSRNATSSSMAASSLDSAPTSQNMMHTPCNKLRNEVMHYESGYVSDEGRIPKFFPSYYHSTPNVSEPTNRCSLDGANSVRNISIFNRPVPSTHIGCLNLSEISAEQEESMLEISNNHQFMTPEVEKKKSERSNRIKNYFSFDESQGHIGLNLQDESFEMLTCLLKRDDQKILSVVFKHLSDADISRLFVVSKEFKSMMENMEEAVSRREKYKKLRLENKENPGTFQIRSRTLPRLGNRKPLGVTQVIVESRKREPSRNDTFDEGLRRDGMCVHCSSCWKTASVIGIIASCTSIDCGYQRCMLCGRQAHSSRPCVKRQTYSSTSYSIGSKESKNNLKRIARR